jgi:protein-disulfide isomerase
MTAPVNPRRPSPKVLIVAAVVLLTVIVSVVATVSLTDDADDAGADPGQTTARLAGIPQSGLVLGSPDAAVTMTVFLDLQCPFCRDFETTAFPAIVDRWVRQGTVKVQMEPWAFLGPDSTRGQLATIAAGRQGKAFDFAALLYADQGPENSGWLDDDLVTEAGRALGLDMAKLDRDRASAAVVDEAEAVAATARRLGVSGTPTVLVGRSGAPAAIVPLASAEDPSPIDAAITRIAGG